MNNNFFTALAFLFFNLVSAVAAAQATVYSFTEVYEDYINYTTDSTNLKTIKDSDKRLLVKLFAQDHWQVSDLKLVDSLVGQDSTGNIGLYTYLAGKAYHDYDTYKEIDFFRKAYLIFEAKNDGVGKFFCLVNIFNSKINTASINETDTNLNKTYQELEELAKQIDYLPVQIRLNESFLRKELKLNQKLKSNVLDEISLVTEVSSPIRYKALTRQLYTSLGIAYQRASRLDTAIMYKRKALHLASANDYDYPSYLVNIGASHFFYRAYDSATYYLRKAYMLMPADPQTPYQASIKQATAYNLGILYNIQKELDSAYFFASAGNVSAKKLLDLKLNSTEIYYDKKFQMQRTELELAKKSAALDKEQQLKKLFAALLIISVALLLFIIFVYRKTNALKKEAHKLQKQREQLLSIVSHDLGEPLQVFSESSLLIPQLIRDKKFTELTLVQETLVDTIISLQNLIKNLFDWNTSLRTKKSFEKATQVDVHLLLQQICATYKVVATLKNIAIRQSFANDLETNTYSFYLGNIFRNVLYNSIKHGRPNSEVFVSANVEDGQDLKFACTNTIASLYSSNIEEIVDHLNGNTAAISFKTGLGLELISEAITQLNARVKASLEDDQFKIEVWVPQVS